MRVRDSPELQDVVSRHFSQEIIAPQSISPQKVGIMRVKSFPISMPENKQIYTPSKQAGSVNRNPFHPGMHRTLASKQSKAKQAASPRQKGEDCQVPLPQHNVHVRHHHPSSGDGGGGGSGGQTTHPPSPAMTSSHFLSPNPNSDPSGLAIVVVFVSSPISPIFFFLSTHTAPSPSP